MSDPGRLEQLASRTVSDFGDQWTYFRENPGYYGSIELLRDLFAPLVAVSEFAGTRVVDIGSGTGRIVRMLAAAGARQIVAVEPSEAFAVLEENTRDLGDRVLCIRATGDRFEIDEAADWVLSIGVLHHIPEPAAVVSKMFSVLRPGGRAAVWLYGREGNRLYLALAGPLRALTSRLPHAALVALCRLLDVPLAGYVALCRVIPLPMRRYMREHVARLSPSVRRITIYDQLNPSWAKYYTYQEARALLEEAGFINVRLHHRNGYSWLVVAQKV